MINLSTSGFYEKATRQIGTLRQQANTLQEQVSSEQKFSRSSEDPVAAARMRTLTRQQRLSEVDESNSSHAMGDLQMADNALSSMADIIIRAQELATQAASATVSDEQRVSIGNEIADLQEGLLLAANSRNLAGYALFGGETSGKAYESDGTTVTYIGTASTKAVALGEDQEVTPSLTGPEVLNFTVDGTSTDLFAVLGNLASALQTGTPDPATAARDSLTGLDAGLEKVTTSQTVIGARMGWVESLDDRRDSAGLLIAEEQQNVGGADLATTITRLQEVMTVLEASQASFVKLANLSLFNLIG